mgnify:CR=1 FL=1
MPTLFLIRGRASVWPTRCRENSKNIGWQHSVFFIAILCIFILQNTMVFICARAVQPILAVGNIMFLEQDSAND